MTAGIQIGCNWNRFPCCSEDSRRLRWPCVDQRQGGITTRQSGPTKHSAKGRGLLNHCGGEDCANRGSMFSPHGVEEAGEDQERDPRLKKARR